MSTGNKNVESDVSTHSPHAIGTNFPRQPFPDPHINNPITQSCSLAFQVYSPSTLLSDSLEF
jgi:hypothetical protein